MGTVEVRVAFKGGQSLDAMRHRDTAQSPSGAGGHHTRVQSTLKESTSSAWEGREQGADERSHG